MIEKHDVFVYGTLRKHEKNHYLLNGSILVAEQASTNGLLYDTGLGYPALKESDAGTVYGELYTVTDEQLAALDVLEGYFGSDEINLYDRKKQTVFHDRGKAKAYVYVISSAKKRMLNTIIESGDWKLHRIAHQSKKILYFAYGSCMDDVRFKKEGQGYHFQDVQGRGILYGYSLRFTRKSSDGGKVDIVECGGVIEGKVYAITEDCLTYLFKREGVFTGCYRPTFVEIEINGILQKDVLTFTVVDKEKETPPSAKYVEEIFRGGSGLLSEPYMSNLKQQLKDTFGLIFE